MNARQDLALGIRSGLAGRVSVYDYPADTIKAPAVVVGPSDPYMVPSTFGRIRVNLDVTVLVPRTKLQDQLTNLDKLLEDVLAAIAGASSSRRFQWVDVSKPDGMTVSDVDYLASTITCTTALE